MVERGAVVEDVLRLILNNVRLPEMNRADLFAIVAGCRAGERAVMGLCERFGKDTYLAALQALLDRPTARCARSSGSRSPRSRRRSRTGSTTTASATARTGCA